MTIGSDAIGRTPNDLEVSNTIGVGTSPSADSVSTFKAGFTKQLPNLATSAGLEGGVNRIIDSVDHGQKPGSPVRIPSGAGGAFEDKEVRIIFDPDSFALNGDITNPITDEQILSSPDLLEWITAIATTIYGQSGISNNGAFFIGRRSDGTSFEVVQTNPNPGASAFALKSFSPSSQSFTFDQIILNGTGIANTRFFRETITTGVKRIILFDGLTGAIHLQLGVDGSGTFFHPDSGNFGIGLSAVPTAHRLEVSGETKLEGSISGGRKTSGAADMDSSGARVLAVTDTTAVRTVTLLTADLLDVNSSKLIQDESGAASGNNISLVTEGSANINGVASETITTDFGNIRVYPNGTNWFIESRR